MLHGGRLGSVREDVAHFTSSIKDDIKLVDAVVAINKAHVVMLIEQKIIPSQDGAKILYALVKHTDFKLDPKAEDVHMALEEAVLAETGSEWVAKCTLPKVAMTKFPLPSDLNYAINFWI
jgi:argininosuccinate lyase